MNELQVLEGVNLFVGDHDPNASRHLTLTDFKLPVLQEEEQDWQPGGSKFGLSVGTGYAKLESSFNVAGADPELMALFGLNDPLKRRFTSYEVFKDRRTGLLRTRKGILEGSLSKVDTAGSKRGEVGGGEFGITQITHFEVYWDGRELVFWDFFTNTHRADGTDLNRDLNSRLGIA